MSELSTPISNKMSSAQLRKIKKPIIEKRRRERINDSLNQLKALVLDSLQKDESRYSKMEKADILEMTVRHLKTVQRQQRLLKAAEDRELFTKYRSGFTECAGEVSRYLSSVGDDLSGDVHQRLLDHLVNCVHKVCPVETAPATARSTLPAISSPPIATAVATLPGTVYAQSAASVCLSRTPSPVSQGQSSPLPSPSSPAPAQGALGAHGYLVLSPTPVHAPTSANVNSAIPLYASTPLRPGEQGARHQAQQRQQSACAGHADSGQFSTSPRAGDEFPASFSDNHTSIPRPGMTSAAVVPGFKLETRRAIRPELVCESSAVWRPW